MEVTVLCRFFGSSVIAFLFSCSWGDGEDGGEGEGRKLNFKKIDKY